MRVLVAMSGGVDSSVAAALLLEQGHEVVGATMKLWGGHSDSGCCSISDTNDARRVADRLGIDHRVFNFSEEFDGAVVAPYANSHAAGETPNPCVECNRHLKFGAFLLRARRLGFDAIATGHHARVVRVDGRAELWRGRDAGKDQSYVLSVLGQAELSDLLLPVGEMTKDDVRRRAGELGLSVAAKPDSQDVCFITSRTTEGARREFLSERISLHAGRAFDVDGKDLGEVEDLELLTVGQRRGLGSLVAGRPSYVLDIDIPARHVRIGGREDLDVASVTLRERTWTSSISPAGTPVLVQTSAHGSPRPAVLEDRGVLFDAPSRRVAPGQVVALYDGDRVLGSGVAC